MQQASCSHDRYHMILPITRVNVKAKKLSSYFTANGDRAVVLYELPLNVEVEILHV